MAGNYRFGTEQKDIVRTLMTVAGSFIQDRLIDRQQRIQHKEQCSERLAAEDVSPDKDTEIRYSDQAVLANLDWGIDALEEAIDTSNTETKMARLDYAEKMLQICAMLNSAQKTAGVPNFYLSAWAHLNLSYLWMLRNDIHNAVLHLLEMFAVDPFFSRIDFAPELWKSLFLPHMGSIVGWYTQERRRIVMDVIPDASDLSFTVDFDQYFDESLILSVRPEQTERIEKLEEVYGQSLDENTRLYAKYYKDCLNYDSATSRKSMPMLPIAEAPATPLHDFSCSSIPDYVKFGPILPKSAGFSNVVKTKENGVVETSRCTVTPNLVENVEDSAAWNPLDEIPEESEVLEDDDDDGLDAYMGTEDRPHETASNSFKSEDTRSVVSNISIRLMNEEDLTSSCRQIVKVDSPRCSPQIDGNSASHSPETPIKISSPKSVTNSGKVPTSMLRLLSTRAMDSLLSPGSPHSSCCDNSSISSADSDSETRGHQKTTKKGTGHGRSIRKSYTKSPHHNQDDHGNQSYVSSPLSDMATPQSRPPKDFVCPITGQIFNDPVTLETGQTYERKAIQEWVHRGNTTCPITRQPLSTSSLPKTNYVLKRLITSWKEQHPDIAQEFSCVETPQSYSNNTYVNEVSSISQSPFQCQRSISNENGHKHQRFLRAAVASSPTSVISQAAVETVINALKPHILCLCNSEDLKECEAAVLTIFEIVENSSVGLGINSYLSSPTIINGFVEILSASLNKDVLRTAVYILSKLIHADERAGDSFTTVDSDFYCLIDLLKKGLEEAAVLMYLLRPSFSHLSAHKLISTLIHIISNKNEDHSGFQYVIPPKDAAIALLEMIVVGGDENDKSRNAMDLILENGIPALLDCLNRVDGRQPIVSILLCCIQIDISCKESIASRIELSTILELFHGGNDGARGLCVEFLCELVQLSRRTLCNQILEIIKDEGTFSTMHTLLVYLQMSPMEQKPTIASLLLQLDLLDAPRKMSIYREEAMEALLEALQRKEFPSSQITVLDTLSSLSGHYGVSRKQHMESWLLKIAGFEQPYHAIMADKMKHTGIGTDFVEMKEEEKALRHWEKRMAFVLTYHEKGIIFKALEECFKSNSIEIAKSSLVVATWLVNMIYSFPDCGIRDVARKSLLDKFINVMQSSKNLEEKILAALALRAFATEPSGLHELGAYGKSIWKTLRRLKKICTVAHDLMKALMKLPSIDAAELWSCVQGPEIDVSINGEIVSMLHIRNWLITSHSDGTIKVWDTEKRSPRLIQEAREHSKAVTCLYIPPPCDRLYTGSLDKTIRVWSIKQEEIHCIQVHDVKEAVMGLTANSSFAYFSTQGNGIKVYNWSGDIKHVNFNRQVKCLALAGDKLYCGCSGYIIQELDLKTGSTSTFYSGPKKLLGKQTIYALEAQKGLLFAGGSSVDGVAGKVFKINNKAVIGSLSTTLDIQQIAVNNDFIFTASKCGIIEVWLKERVTKIAYIKMVIEGNSRIMSLSSDADGFKLFAATSDGKLQTWNLE